MHVVLNMLIFTRTLVTFARTTFKPRWCLNFQSVCARKRSLLTLHITCLDRSRWKYYGTVVNILSFLEMGWQTKNDKWPVCCCACCPKGSTNSASLQTPLTLSFKSAVNSCMGIARPVWTACTYESHPRSPSRLLSDWAVQQIRWFFPG